MPQHQQAQATNGNPVLSCEKIVVLSTAHIPERTAKALGDITEKVDDAELWNVLSYVHWHEHGWIIYVSEDAEDAVREAHPELAHLIALCVQAGATYLQLDNAAVTVEGLPVFAW
ncbi:hypothetical protein [Ralstonia pseudosolanacearum]|uniref:DUF5983 family protein n=1 Tax=Ralstonia pseudosolanacearum TaxID=1310165 RepID=UPI003CEF0ABC